MERYHSEIRKTLAQFGFDPEQYTISDGPLSEEPRPTTVNITVDFGDETVFHIIDQYVSWKTMFRGKQYGMVSDAKKHLTPEMTGDALRKQVENLYRTKEVLSEMTDEEWTRVLSEKDYEFSDVTEAAHQRLDAKRATGTLPEWPKGTFDLEHAA